MAATTTTLTPGSPTVTLDVIANTDATLSFSGAPWNGATLLVEYAPAGAPTAFRPYPKNPQIPYPYNADGAFALRLLGTKLRLTALVPHTAHAPSILTEFTPAP